MLKKREIVYWSDDEIKSHILRNSLYGVDIDEDAVKKCKLRLIKHNDGTLINDLNIKHGNSLIDFSWELEFPETLRYGGFNIIIGNPPYVRQEKLKKFKPILAEKFETFISTADLYVYFIELSIRLLKQEGYLANIISNKFLKARYGRKLRNYILKNCKILEFRDEFEKDVFETASVDPCIIILTRDFDNKNNKILVNERFLMEQSSLKEPAWNFLTPDIHDIKKTIEYNCALLKDYSGEPFSGIKTGLTEILVVNEDKMNEIIGHNLYEREIFVPFIRGKDISKWKYDFQHQYLIYTEQININEFPNVKKYLESNRDSLSKRTDIKNSSKEWFQLRPCTYYEEFYKPKILYPDISSNCRFAFDKKGVFVNNTAYIIPKDDKFLLGVLNSRLIEFYYQFISVKLGKAGYRFIQQYVDLIPIRKPVNDQKQIITKIVEMILYLHEIPINDEIMVTLKFLDEILLNCLIYELYLQDYLDLKDNFFEIIAYFLTDFTKEEIITRINTLKHDKSISNLIMRIKQKDWIKKIEKNYI